MKWRCKRCEAIFDDSDKRCNCTISPSPWEPMCEPIRWQKFIHWLECLFVKVKIEKL